MVQLRQMSAASQLTMTAREQARPRGPLENEQERAGAGHRTQAVMHKAIIAAAIGALLFASYAAARHWLAPRFVRDTLVDQAGRLGFELRLEQVRTDPFALSVVLENVEVLAPGGRKLAAPTGQAPIWRGRRCGVMPGSWSRRRSRNRA